MSAPTPERAPVEHVDVVELPDPDEEIPCARLKTDHGDHPAVCDPYEPARWRLRIVCVTHTATMHIGDKCAAVIRTVHPTATARIRSAGGLRVDYFWCPVPGCGLTVGGQNLHLDPL